MPPTYGIKTMVKLNVAGQDISCGREEYKGTDDYLDNGHFKFDISSYGGATVNKAEFHLFMWSNNLGSSYNLSAARGYYTDTLYQTWTEGTSAYSLYYELGLYIQNNMGVLDNETVGSADPFGTEYIWDVLGDGSEFNGGVEWDIAQSNTYTTVSVYHGYSGDYDGSDLKSTGNAHTIPFGYIDESDWFDVVSSESSLSQYVPYLLLGMDEYDLVKIFGNTNILGNTII